MKVSELSGDTLNFWVARAMGATVKLVPVSMEEKQPYAFLPDCQYISPTKGGTFKPAESWMQGGPIIESEGIDLEYHNEYIMGADRKWWEAYYRTDDVMSCFSSEAPLVSAMRAVVEKHFGETVPDEEAA